MGYRDHVEWEEYWQVGPASDADIDRVEGEIGHTLPVAVRTELKAHQGMAPVPSLVDLRDGLPKIDFGPLFHCVNGRNGYIPLVLENLRAGGYPERLVPISMSSGGQPHFALDYGRGDGSPSVVYVQPEVGYQDEALCVAVADSWEELLTVFEAEEQ